MIRVMIIAANTVLFAFTVLLYHKAFLAGHITRVGALMMLAPILALFACLTGKNRKIFPVLAALVNGILLACSGYVFYGTARLLFSNMANPAVYIWVLSALCLAAGCVMGRSGWMGAVYIAILAITSIAGLYFYIFGIWQPVFNAAVLGFIVQISGINVWYALSRILSHPPVRKVEE